MTSVHCHPASLDLHLDLLKTLSLLPPTPSTTSTPAMPAPTLISPFLVPTQSVVHTPAAAAAAATTDLYE